MIPPRLSIPRRYHLPAAEGLFLAALAATFLWSYWPALAAMTQRWSHDPRYSHGFLVPVFALYLLWHRRERLPAWKVNPWGLVFLGLAGLMRLGGVYFFLTWLEGWSLVACLLALPVLLGSWKGLAWSWPAVAFLLFMVPLPFHAEVALAQPLQRLATLASTAFLVILGFPAFAEGNIITVNQSKIGVAQACSGLSMLMTFFALTVSLALVKKRPLADKLVIVASAIPIALLGNIVRITMTGVLYETVGSEAARIFFHDLAGWFMMVLALVMLLGELWILSHLFLDTETEPSGPLALAKP